MKTGTQRLTVALAWLALPTLIFQLSPVFAQGTVFTYQGRLNDGANPANGSYDLTFSLFNVSTGGGATSGPLTQNAIVVSNGLFTVALDFGAGVFNGASYWLEIGVRTNGASTFAMLAPRQPLTPVPYAIFAESVGSGGLAAGTYANPVTLNNAGNSFSGSGSGLTGLNASQLTSGSVPAAALGNAWTITGNAGTTPGANFIGTTDATPLDLRAGGARGLELRDGSRSTGFLAGVEGMNVIGGSYSNYVAAGILGCTIAGGGYSYGTFLSPTVVNNSIYSDLGAIGGGSGNIIGLNSPGSVVAGGSYNADWNGSTNSTIAGGYGNQLYSVYSAIGGGYQNTIGSVGQYNALGGGSGNLIQQGATAVVLAGGINNWAGPDGNGGAYAAVVGGGHNNNADGDYSVVPGGDSNWSPGAYSFAAGRRAKATYAGQFVWADSQNADFFPATYYGAGNGFTSDSFCVRARGGVVFTATSAFPSIAEQAVLWFPGSGGWTIVSDRNAKDRFADVDPEAVLEKVAHLPTSEWSYKGYSQRHIGPMAQDFHALFPLNDSDKTLDELDLHGVELTAIKGLNQKVEEESAALRARNADLQREIDTLKGLVVQLSQRINAGGK